MIVTKAGLQVRVGTCPADTVAFTYDVVLANATQEQAFDDVGSVSQSVSQSVSPLVFEYYVVIKTCVWPTSVRSFIPSFGVRRLSLHSSIDPSVY